MTWTFSTDLAAYLAAARPAVAAQPVVNTTLLTVTDALERRGPRAFGDTDPLFGWWTGADGTVDGALLHTPPFPLLLGAVPPEAVRALAGALGSGPLRGRVGGFNARRADAQELAAAWGAPARVVEELRLYRLGTLAAPEPAPEGRARTAAEPDLPLLLEWIEAFDRECGIPASPSEAQVRDRISYGGLLLWELDGRPVSLAGFSRPIGGASRVGPVYTPPADRGRGHAAGVTHAASRAAYAAGAAEVLLFTDLANPTSNGVYQRLGYAPVEDRVVLEAL
ncbi:GNAT family N-acetyltransferase [Streptomyces lavendulae]|uniref:GNAT family N-acetyltransferase n=1 Tax=Streptomyces lavendulae TaxID=1914 RepID=UPI0024A60286|nr:GNAT family N-acetyltransferase [Streptomyces lavendulae]GLX21302.1 N-acetyltransferase [Streptomyces lavendulae subsp. lavendulae]GLX27820.1 N-acetyltransferase [Streptomyces lavendulae subsp. lavendulae]